jgi:4-amino-4-deoxy-L-arabinose transferase-like glycosyltransferase
MQQRSLRTSLSTSPAGSSLLSRPRAIALASLLWLALICWLAFFNGLGTLGLMDKTEALFVEVGHQMLQRDDWVTPWWNGRTFFDYPVWGYWMVALSFRLFGMSPWAARLPVALAASAVVVAAFLMLWQLAPTQETPRSRWMRAALGAGVLATSPGWIGWGRSSTTDMFLASAISLALFSFLLAHRLPERSPGLPLARILMALFAGIAVLAKGPVGLLLPLLVVGAFLVLSRGWDRWLRPGPLLAMTALFLGVVMPWYSAAAQANGQAFLGGFLAFSNVQRFTTVLYAHPGPPWFYLPWLLLLLFPWSLQLPMAVTQLGLADRRRFQALLRGRADHDPVPLFLLLWLLVVVGFFSAAATKLPGYILPAVPAGALLVCLGLRPFEGVVPHGKGLRLSAWLQALLLGILAVAAALAPRWAASDPAHPQFGSALASSGLPTLLAVVLALTTAALVMALVRWPAGARWIALPLLAGFLAILTLVVPPLGALIDRERQLPLRQLAATAQREARADEPLWVVGTKRYSTVFYAAEPAAFVADRHGIQERQQNDPASLRLGPATHSVRLFGDRTDLDALKLAPAQIERLDGRGQQELWRVPIAAFENR